MKIKTKLLVLVSSLVLLCAILIVGVWATTSTDFKVSGGVSFNATGINATISQGVLSDTGEWAVNSDSDIKMKEIVISADKTSTQIEQEFLSWQGLDFVFKEEGIITFTIQNESTIADEYVMINVSVSGGTMQNATASINKTSAVLAPNGGSQEFFITFTSVTKTANASLTGFEVEFNMVIVKPVEASSTPLTFSYNDETEIGTASVIECDTSVKELEIPAIVKNNDKVYFVDEIAGYSNTSRVFNKCYSLTSLIIPNGVTRIGYRAFFYCRKLANITIPASVTYIENGAFSYCDGLKNVNYLGTIKQWAMISFESGTANPFRCIEKLVIQGKEIESITAEDLEGLTSIGQNAFSGCANLESVTIPDSVTEIGYNAFWECANLKSVTIPSSVKRIGGRAFCECSSLTNLIIPASVTSIGAHAFYDCSELTYNYLGTLKGWVSILFGTMSSNPAYFTKKLVIQGNEITTITADDLQGVRSIGAYAFYKCSGLTSVTIPFGVKSIFDYAFYGCSGLTSVTIPNSVVNIEDFAFSGCSGLTSVKILEGVKGIAESAFSGCSGLTSIKIPESMIVILGSAFSGCSNLKTVMIDSSVVAKGLASTSQMGYLIHYSRTVYIKTEIVNAGGVGKYVTDIKNFPNVQIITEGDYAGYTKYSR